MANPVGKEIKLFRKIRFVFKDDIIEGNIMKVLKRIRAGEDPVEVECIGIEESMMKILKQARGRI